MSKLAGQEEYDPITGYPVQFGTRRWKLAAPEPSSPATGYPANVRYFANAQKSMQNILTYLT